VCAVPRIWRQGSGPGGTAESGTAETGIGVIAVVAGAAHRCGHAAAGLTRARARSGRYPLGRQARCARPALSWSDDLQEAGSTPATPLTDALHRIEREARPPMRCAGHRGRPPQLLGKWPLADDATLRASRSRRCNARGCGHASFRALLRDARQESADFSLPVPTVPAERPDRRELSRLRPPGHCLRVNPEHCCNFCGREQWLSLWCTC
jgi:hypothetical protein